MTTYNQVYGVFCLDLYYRSRITYHKEMELQHIAHHASVDSSELQLELRKLHLAIDAAYTAPVYPHQRVKREYHNTTTVQAYIIENCDGI